MRTLGLESASTNLQQTYFTHFFIFPLKEEYKRKNYTLDVVEMTVTSQMVNIGRWSEEEGLILSGGANGAARYRPSNRKLASVFLTTLSWG